MYTPAHFAVDDAALLHRLIESNGFASLVSVCGGRPVVSHIPMLLDVAAGTLRGHVARANPQWRELDGARDVLAVFHGPHAYVSPTWYREAGVPTWNYAVVHVYGRARVIQDSAWLHRLVSALSEQYEARREPPWDGEYEQRQLRAIVGIEISISEIQGKFKLSQNRSDADRQGVIDQLAGADDTQARAVATLMRAQGPARGQ